MNEDNTTASSALSAAAGQSPRHGNCQQQQGKVAVGDLVSVAFSSGVVEGGTVTTVGLGPQKDGFKVQWPDEEEAWQIDPRLHNVRVSMPAAARRKPPTAAIEAAVIEPCCPAWHSLSSSPSICHLLPCSLAHFPHYVVQSSPFETV